MIKRFFGEQRIWGIVPLGLFLLMIFSGAVAYAEQPSLEGSYEVRPLIEESQKQAGIDYFSLVVQPEETRDISIEIMNHASTAENFQVQLNRAYTNSNGFIDYSKNTAGENPSLAVNISQLTDNRQQVVTVEPQSSKQVTFQLKLPKESFEGILLGGIYVTKIENNELQKNQTNEAGVQLKQQLAYGIAVMLQEKIPYQGVEKVLLHGLDTGAVDNQSVLTFELENPQPNLMKDVSMTTTIYKDGTKASYATLTKDGLSFAPNSSFSLNIPWSQQEIQTGDYQAETVVTSAKNQWKFSNRFSVTAKQISKIQAKGDPVKKISNISVLTWLVGGLITLMLLVLLTYLIWQIRQRKSK